MEAHNNLNKKLITDFYMWMVEHEYDHNIRLRVERKAEIFLKEQEQANGLSTSHKTAFHKHVVMPRCSTCKFWKQNTFYCYEGAENDGFCSELGSELTIELKTGWDGGYVNSIETKSTFGCVLHNGA